MRWEASQLLGLVSSPMGRWSLRSLRPPPGRVEGSGRGDAPSYKKLEVLFPSKASWHWVLQPPCPGKFSSNLSVCVRVRVLPEPKLPKNQTTLSLALNLLQAEWWLPISVLGGVWKSLNAQFLWPTFQYYITSLIASLPSTPPPTRGCWDFKNPICHLKAYSAPTQFCLPPFRLQFQFKHQVMPSWVGQNPRKP